MSKFLDMYDIVKCTRANNGCIDVIAKRRDNSNQFQFTYDPENRTDNMFAQMMYNDLHSAVSDSNGELDNKADKIRNDRHMLLCNTDIYLAIPDYPITNAQREEIRSYRQALRDITKQPGFPEHVEWPEPPECIK